MKRVIYAALLLLLSGVYERGNCQSSRPKFKMEDFSAAGTAYRSGGNCFVLTEDDFWQGGSIWYKQPISLDAPFNMEMKINFGDRDEFGADGIVFVFYPRPDVDGRAGEGMGFGGLRPSLGIEIDTYQNYHLDDPEEDHIAFMVNGITHHAHSIAGPVRVNPTGNIEDGQIHLVKIDWDPAIHYLRIYIDHQLRLSLQQNLKENIFAGNPTVYWGFTAATGKRTNRQAVCIDKIEFLPPPPVLPALSRETLSSISAGKLVSLDLIEFAPGKSDINPAIGKQLDQLAGLLHRSPGTILTINGHTDSSGNEDSNLRLSQQRADALSKYLQKRGIPAERLRATGYGSRYPAASNKTEAGRKQNRRIEVYLSKDQV